MLIDGTKTKLGIKISTDAHPSMPDVYNIAFGPFDENIQIDDEAELTHQDHSKVFSTIVLSALSFLKEHKGKYLGFDGSDTARAYMYYRCIQKNYTYLKSFFNFYGINYFLRVLRDGSNKYDPEDLLMVPNLISSGENVPVQMLYNYFVFNEK